MSIINIEYDTEAKTMKLSNNGVSLPDPRYVMFDWIWDDMDSTPYKYRMSISHDQDRGDGTNITTTVTAEKTQEAIDHLETAIKKYKKDKMCKDGEKCKK